VFYTVCAGRQDMVDALSQIDHKEELSEEERMRNLLGSEHSFPPKGERLKLKGLSGRNEKEGEGRGGGKHGKGRRGPGKSEEREVEYDD
jgi:hypothetical protein